MKILTSRWLLGLYLLLTGCESKQVNYEVNNATKTTDSNTTNSVYSYVPPSTKPRINRTVGTNYNYIPPSFESRVNRTRGTATVECDAAFLNSPTLLQPKEDAAKKTLSSHPTFLFHLKSYSRKSLLFTLTQADIAEPIFEKKLQGISGVVAIKLPQELPGLKTGKKYNWTITSFCNEPGTHNGAVSAGIERVEPVLSLNQKLISVTSSSKRAQLYDQFGIGYDTISSVYESLTTNSKPSSDLKTFEELLKKNIEAYTTQEDFSNSKVFEDLLEKNSLVKKF